MLGSPVVTLARVRPLTVALVAALFIAPAVGAAQTGSTLQVYFDPSSMDSAYAAATGGEIAALILSSDAYGVGLGGFRLRLYFDPARVKLDSAVSACPDAVGSPLSATLGINNNNVLLQANGCSVTPGYSVIGVATVYLKLISPDAGSVLYLSPDSAADLNRTNRSLDAQGDLVELCRGNGLWGDVDGDAKVNSRDALVALSSAVGLPTPGFQVQQGDVDDDGLVTSRDALAMLSNSIGLTTYGFRVGQLVVVACAPQEPLPRTLYASTSGTYYNGRPGNNGLTIRPAFDSTLNIVGDSAEDPYSTFNYSGGWRPKVSPDGSTVLFVCYFTTTLGYAQICSASADGKSLTLLTTNTSLQAFSPDWSPAGDSIIYISAPPYGTAGQISIMDRLGNGQRPIVSSPTDAMSVAWRPVGGDRHIAYTNSNQDIRTREIDQPSLDSLMFASTFGIAYNPRFVDWSPEGDSLTFDLQVSGSYAVVAKRSLSNAPLFKRASASAYPGPREPMWSDQGVAFVAAPRSSAGAQLYLRRNDGRVARLTRALREPHFPGMKKVGP